MEVKISKTDFWEAQKLNIRPSPVRRTFWLLLGTIFTFYVYEKLDWPVEMIALALAGAICGHLGYVYVYLKIRSNRIFDQQQSLQRAYKLCWDEKGFTVSNDNSHSKINWSEILKVKESDNIILYYFSDNLFGLTKKSDFSSQNELNDFVSRLRAGSRKH